MSRKRRIESLFEQLSLNSTPLHPASTATGDGSTAASAQPAKGRRRRADFATGASEREDSSDGGGGDDAAGSLAALMARASLQSLSLANSVQHPPKRFAAAAAAAAADSDSDAAAAAAAASDRPLSRSLPTYPYSTTCATTTPSVGLLSASPSKQQQSPHATYLIPSRKSSHNSSQYHYHHHHHHQHSHLHTRRTKSPSISFARLDSQSPVKRHVFSRKNHENSNSNTTTTNNNNNDQGYQQHELDSFGSSESSGRRNQTGMWPGMASSSNSSSGYVGQSRTTANHVSKSSNTNFIPCIGFSSGSSSSGAGDILHGTTPTTYRRQQRLNSLDSFSDKNIHKSSGQYSISASKSPQYEQSHLPMSLLSSPPAMPSLLGPSFASSTYTKFESSINQPSSMTTNSIDSESGEIPLLSNFGTEEEFQFLGTAMPYSPTTCSFPGRESTKSIRDDDYYADDDDDDDDDEYEDDSCTMFRPRGRRTRRGKAGGSTRVSNDRSNGGVFKSSRDRSEKFGRSGGGGNKSLGLEGGGGGGKGNKNAIAAGAAAAVTHDNESIDIHDALNKYAFKFGSDDSGRGGSSGRTTSKSASSLTADLLKSSAFSVMSNSFLNPFPTHHRLNPDHGQIILYRPLTIIPDTNSSFPTKHQFTFTLPFNSTPTDDFMTLSPTTVSSGSFPVMNEAIPIASSVGNPTLSGVATATTSTTNSPITRRHHNTSPNRQQEQAKLMMMLESNGNDACDEGVANVMSSSSSSSNTNNQGLSPLVGLDRNSPRPVHRFHHVGNQGAAASPVSARNLFPNGSSGKGNGGLSSNTANMELD